MNRLQCSKAHRNRTVPDQARLPGLRGPARRSPPPAHTRATEKSISSTPTCVSSSRWRAPGMPGRLSPAQVSREGSLPGAAAARRRGRGLGRRGGPRGAPPRAPRTPPPRPRPTPRRPARPRGGEAAGAGPASASGAAARGRRRSEARRTAEAGGGRGLRLLLLLLLPLLLLLRRRPWRARGVSRWESGWGAAFVARLRAHAWVAAVIETVRVVLDERHAAGAGGRAIVITSWRTRMKFVI